MPSLVGSDRIERLEILNFKSLKRHQIVGPFKDFAAIVEAKGAGRADLVAAITFVLGVRTFQLRGHHLREDHLDEAKGRIAFVKLAVCTARGEEIKFGRAITRSGTSEYRINNIPVTWEMYNQTMQGLDILGDVVDSDACEELAPVSHQPMISTQQKRKLFAAEREQKREQNEDHDLEADEHLWLDGPTSMDLNGAAAEMMNHELKSAKNMDKSLHRPRESAEVEEAEFDEYESLREKERKHNEELEAARKSAIEAADKWKATSTNQPIFRSLDDEGDHAATRSDSIGNEQGADENLHHHKSGEFSTRDGGTAGVSREIGSGDKNSHRSFDHHKLRAETSSQPDHATDSDTHTSQWLENLDDRMYWSDIDPDEDSLGKAEELAGMLLRDAMELHERLSAEEAADHSARFCSDGQIHLMAETKETCGAIMYANGHGGQIIKNRLGGQDPGSELMLVGDSESRPLSFSQTSQTSSTDGGTLGATERAHLDRISRPNQRHAEHVMKKISTSDDDLHHHDLPKTSFADGDEDGGGPAGKEVISRLRESNVRKQVKIDSLQKWKAYYKVELEARVQNLEQVEKQHAKEVKKREKAARKMKKKHREEIAQREMKSEGMETKLREQIKELNLVIEELSGQLYDMEEHLAATGISYKPSVNEHTGPSSKTLLSAVIGVKEAAHTFSRTFMSYLKQHLTKARDLDEQICLESEVIVARPSDYKFLVQSFICRRMFSDFDSECFNIESCMTEIFDIDDHSRACFQEYMTYRNVSETVTLLTDNRQHSGFLREFCFKKFLHIVSESTEEAFFGDFNHSDDICAGRHPSSRFYESYCKLAVSVWLLHRLSFSFQPPARMISVRKGAHFDPAYMESAVPGIADGTELGTADGSGLPFEALVGLMVHPGFRVGSSIIPAQVYLVTT